MPMGDVTSDVLSNAIAAWISAREIIIGVSRNVNWLMESV